MDKQATEPFEIEISEVENGNTEELVPKRGALSVVWRYFGFRKSDFDQKNILCKICLSKVAASGGNTSNLLHHLSRRHVSEYEECMKLKTAPFASAGNPKSLQDALARGAPYDRKSKRWLDITNAITIHLAKDMVALNTVEKEGFKQMIRTLDPRYEVPSGKYFGQIAIPNLYEKHRAKLGTELAAVRHFAATTDMWLSHTMEPYFGVTVHFISDDWLLQSHRLQTSYFPDEHTGELLAAGLQEALDSWGLPQNKLVAITTDDGDNIKKAVELNKWTGLQCFGHRLHRAIGKGLRNEGIQQAIALCKKIVSTFSYSSKKRRDLAIVQNYLGLPNHMLTAETPTRWGSRQTMIQRVLEQERAISHVLKDDKKSRHLVPSWQDLDVLEAVNKALGPLQDFTDALSGEQYVSVSYLKPVLKLFNASILAEEENDTQLTKDVKRNILADLNEKYSDTVVDDLLDMASLLDPRFRTKYVDEEKVERVLSRVVEEIVSLMKTQQDVVQGAAGSEAEAEPDDPPKVKRKKTLASFFKREGGAMTEEESVRKELTVYLQTTEVDSDVDPFDWWKCHQTNFPHVAKLARHYLCIPATSAPSERAFSTDGNMVPCHRAALKPDAVDRLVFLAQNL
ncbi:zinc finger BED domain-containing protein 1-like [Hippocampus comes]|uniref:zinc finger BED domain-containing protein 1-like n=1 Tax=Hippocampus comes TaxID=109280 RepID=UPI00094EB9E0|nr:PREDICTED: zinc finger BED domain-containing protein 1-like [Hippocampus comes]